MDAIYLLTQYRDQATQVMELVPFKDLVCSRRVCRVWRNWLNAYLQKNYHGICQKIGKISLLNAKKIISPRNIPTSTEMKVVADQNDAGLEKNSSKRIERCRSGVFDLSVEETWPSMLKSFATSVDYNLNSTNSNRCIASKTCSDTKDELLENIYNLSSYYLNAGYSQLNIHCLFPNDKEFQFILILTKIENKVLHVESMKKKVTIGEEVNQSVPKVSKEITVFYDGNIDLAMDAIVFDEERSSTVSGTTFSRKFLGHIPVSWKDSFDSLLSKVGFDMFVQKSGN